MNRRCRCAGVSKETHVIWKDEFWDPGYQRGPGYEWVDQWVFEGYVQMDTLKQGHTGNILYREIWGRN